MKSWQEEVEDYRVFKGIVAQKGQNVGQVLNKLIRRYNKENSETSE